MTDFTILVALFCVIICLVFIFNNITKTITYRREEADPSLFYKRALKKVHKKIHNCEYCHNNPTLQKDSYGNCAKCGAPLPKLEEVVGHLEKK